MVKPQLPRRRKTTFDLTLLDLMLPDLLEIPTVWRSQKWQIDYVG